MQLTLEKSKKVYTYQDYEKLPEGAPYQLIGGQLIKTPSLVPYHQDIVRKISIKLSSFIEEKRIGKIYISPLDVCFSDTEIYQPDIIFISKERLHIIGEKNIEGPPDLIIEILSPATAYYDLRVKKDTYEKTGVKEYWIVDPIQHIIEVFQNKNGKFEIIQSVRTEGVVNSVIIPEFNLEAKEIFS